MHYCPYKYYIGFVTLSSTDKQSNLEMSSLLILPLFTLLMYTRLTPVSLPRALFVHVDLSNFFLLSDSGRHWHPPSHPFPPAHKNGTFTMFILLKLLILLTISLLTNILLNYAVYFSIFLGGCMAASTLCILCVVSRHISCI